MNHKKIMRVKHVSEYTSLAVSTIWKYVALNQFPKPHKLSMRVTVWDSEEIDIWIEKQLSENNERGKYLC
mgnify:CR=1 FL=1